MLNKMIIWSLEHRFGVIMVSFLLLVFGIITIFRLPVDVLPDLTKPTVVILTEAPGLAPEEVETRVTQPLENALMGVAGLERIRSNSDVALSLVYAEFDWGSDIYKNRILIQERLQSAREVLPEGVQPFMTPVSSLMGEILLIGVRSTIPEGQPGYLNPGDVRTVADWTIRPRLQSIPGIAEVLNMGGGIKQIEVQPDPYRMQVFHISFEELGRAVRESASTTTGGFIETGSTEIMVRNLAMTTDPDVIGETIIKRSGDRPVRISDVAKVTWGTEPMRGDAAVSQFPEKSPTYGVIMSISKAPEFDTRKLTDEVKRAIEELNGTLPEGVETLLLFQQKDFIDNSIGNLKHAIIEAAVMVTIVLLVFLLSFRTTFITLTAIPMSFAMTVLAFKWMGISVNSMTLGGLAVAIGMVVDDAIVGMENVYRRLRENASASTPLPRFRIVAESSAEVRSSIFYATLLIVLVLVPLLGLTGVEGKLFTPIAIATILSMIASFMVSLTIVPVLCLLMLNPKPGYQHTDGWLVRTMKSLLESTFLKWALYQPRVVLLVVGVGGLAIFSLYPKMGKDFLPPFKEKTALIATTSAPGTSLAEMNRISDIVEEQILSVPEVARVGRRVGRAERGDHVVPVSSAEFDVDFQEIEGRKQQRSRQEILNDITERIHTVPGVFAAISGPLADRIGHMMSGVSAPVAIKIFGNDLDALHRIGMQVQSLAKTIPGFENAQLDQQSSIPQLRIEIDRNRSATYGISPGDLNERLSTLVGGEQILELRDGQRRINLTLRLPLEWRDSPEKLAQLPIQTDTDQSIPLSAIAEIREAKGPNIIFRENMQRRFTVAIKPTAGNVGVLVDTLKDKIEKQIKLPEGYFVTYEGEFEAQREATLRIAILGVAVLLIILFLLAGYFKSIWLSLQVLISIPLSLVGGLLSTWLMVNNISIATLVGLIAVGGVAARNGIMMLSHYLHLIAQEGEAFTPQMVVRGTLERMVPVLMTALAAGIALIPFMLAADEPGKEILHPIAVVMVGGLISSTILNFLVTPLIFYHCSEKTVQRSISRGAQAAL